MFSCAACDDSRSKVMLKVKSSLGLSSFTPTTFSVVPPFLATVQFWVPWVPSPHGDMRFCEGERGGGGAVPDSLVHRPSSQAWPT